MIYKCSGKSWRDSKSELIFSKNFQEVKNAPVHSLFDVAREKLLTQEVKCMGSGIDFAEQKRDQVRTLLFVVFS